jgi:hypothetical protein
VRRLGPLEWIFVTPSNHRVHHARNPRYLDKNYGGVFILWDRIFGTFQDELKEEPCIYGTVKPLSSWNPLWANFHVWWQMLRMSWKTRRTQDKVLVWFKGPGWFPEDLRDVYESNPQAPKFNPVISKAISFYAFVNFWLITAASLWLLEGFNEMPRLLVLALFFWMSFSLYVFGCALEGHDYWHYLEWVRILATYSLVSLCLLLWRDYLNSWGLALAVYGGFCFVSVGLMYWLDVKPQQSAQPI